MTITVKCQYTGIEFEASSKRQKNHPLVSKFLEEASKEIKIRPMAYNKAKELLSEARGNFDNIDELMAAVRAAYADWSAGAPQRKVLSYKERLAISHAQINQIDRICRGDDYEEQTDGNAYSGNNPNYR